MPQTINTTLTPQELRLKVYLRILFFIYTAATFLYLLPAIGWSPHFLQPFHFFKDAAYANNSTIKMVLCAGLCFLGSADVRKYLVAVEVLIGALVVATFSGLLLALFATPNYTILIGTHAFSIRTIILFSTIADTLINVLLLLFYFSAQKARYQLQYFNTFEFKVLTALAAVVIQGDDKILTDKEVAYNVDRYMSSFRAKTKWVTKLSLLAMEIYPLFFFQPPISYMRQDDRKRFLMKHFYQNITLRLVPPFVRTLVQGFIRLGKQLCFMGYYNDSRVFASIGYIPFSKRVDKEDRIAKFPIQPRKNLYVLGEKDITGKELIADVVIVGSGPAAAVLAKGLIEEGRQVLLVERGDYTDPSQFSEDEIDMVSRLYADGALQQARDFRFQVIQGSCVGGSSVVNNAVCFDTPHAVLDKWNDKQGLNAGLDLERYKECNASINTIIGVRKMTGEDYLNPGGNEFVKGVLKMGLAQSPNIVSAVSANIQNHGCLGCGYCNIGCAYGKKLSMLDTVLPDTQATYGREALQIIAGCEVWQLHSSGGKITSLTAKFSSGKKLTIKAKTVVVAAGALSSSILLQRSGIAKGKAGKRLSFNIGSPMNAVFPQVINAYDGLQISHYLQLSPDRGYIFETWFNPPMFQSTVMPGWWDDHYKNMHRYNRFACTGVLVGSESNAEVRIAGLTGREIRYTPTKTDFNTLLDGLIVAGDIYLEAGAESVLPNTFDYHEYYTTTELRMLKLHVNDNSDITLGTGHPQGGNAISATEKRGVVNPEFKVYGYDNLFVCDASVFPSSLGVNPQITVMSLARYATPFVAAN